MRQVTILIESSAPIEEVGFMERAQTQNAQMKAAHKKIRGLERKLQRKEKALSEAAALLFLQKKARAIWRDDEDA